MIFYSPLLNKIEIEDPEYESWFVIAFMKHCGWEFVGYL